MKTINRLLLIACLTLPLLAACKKEEAPQEAVAAPLTAPADATNDEAWGAYLQDVVRRNLGKITNAPYLYYLPAEGTPDFDGNYSRLGEQMTTDLMRGIVEGNMIAYGSPASAKMADLVIESFTNAKIAPGSMEGVRVLFIGAPADAERVKAAVAPTGATFEFIEAK